MQLNQVEFDRDPTRPAVCLLTRGLTLAKVRTPRSPSLSSPVENLRYVTPTFQSARGGT